MLDYVMSCYVMLCYVMLRYVTLCYAQCRLEDIARINQLKKLHGYAKVVTNGNCNNSFFR